MMTSFYRERGRARIREDKSFPMLAQPSGTFSQVFTKFSILPVFDSLPASCRGFTENYNLTAQFLIGTPGLLQLTFPTKI